MKTGPISGFQDFRISLSANLSAEATAKEEALATAEASQRLALSIAEGFSISALSPSWIRFVNRPPPRYSPPRVSIVTKTGDQGTTGLMYGRRVSKNHPRVESYGAVDELNAALGLARAAAVQDFLRQNLQAIQADLVILMGELATAKEDLPRYEKDGYKRVSPSMTRGLEKLVEEIESQNLPEPGKDWVAPGASTSSAALDVARAVCRRAERRVCALQSAGELPNGEIMIYLNRLSDLLWLMARWTESRP